MAPPTSIGQARKRLPDEFLESLHATFPQGILENILHGMCARRPTSLRVNSLRSDPREFVRFLRERGVKHRRIPWYADAFVLPDLRERDVRTWDWYREGRIYLQGLSSMIPALALAPRPGERILDLAAAPGSKTTQMAALMENRGSILAIELNAVRAERLRYNVTLQGCRIVEVRTGRGERIGDEMSESFDAVLLDSPCSGEGRFVVGEPATSRSWSPRLVADRARLQRKLLASGFKALRPGGVLVYSTCTLNVDENERIVEQAMRLFALTTERVPVSVPGTWSGVGVSNALRIFPDAEREGFFICRMRKTA